MKHAHAPDPSANKAFTETAGQIITQALHDGTDQHDYIARLARAYVRLVNDLPELDEDAY